MLSLLLPILYQFVFPSIEFFVNDERVELVDNDVNVVLIGKDGEVLDGRFEVEIGRWHDKVELPKQDGEFSVYRQDLCCGPGIGRVA